MLLGIVLQLLQRLLLLQAEPVCQVLMLLQRLLVNERHLASVVVMLPRPKPPMAVVEAVAATRRALVEVAVAVL